VRIQLRVIAAVLAAIPTLAHAQSAPPPARPAPSPYGDAEPPGAEPPDAEPTSAEPIDAEPIAPEPPAAPPPPAVEELPDPGGADFGPVVVIEAIEIVGNRTTQDRVIRRALSVRVGDVLRAVDPRLLGARYKILALGYFRDVKLALRRGSQRGKVVLTIHVLERGTAVLNRLWFGTSDASVFWLGADVEERNLLGTGLAVGGGAVFARAGNIPGSRDQWAVEARVADPAVGTSRWGVGASFSVIHGSEPYRIAGEATDSDADHFRAFDYRRIGGRVTASYAVTALARVTLGGRVELVDADLPAAPSRRLPDGREVPIDLGLHPGGSRVVSGFVGFDRDTRPDPALPHEGQRVAVSAELGSTLVGGDYDFATLLGRWERWWPLRGGDHALGLRTAGGIILGEAPRFDRIHISDVNRLITPRALGLVVATQAPLDLLGTDNEDIIYGEVGGSAIVEYAVKLFRKRFHVYGGDLFVGAGVWALATTDDLSVRDRGVWDALPLDLVIDAGLRIDTEIGVFELTVANALGRIAL
jgi:hypothetical protein